jgi:hypothetical protein
MKSYTGADPVNLIEASTMTCRWVCLWALMLVLTLLAVGWIVGLDAVAAAKVDVFAWI